MKAVLKALKTTGFLKAFYWSFGSFFAGWIITALAMPEMQSAFGSTAWIIPTLNSFLVLLKQTWDEKVEEWKKARNES